MQGENRKNSSDLLDLIPFGACVIDEEFNVIFWNKTMEFWTKITADNAIGTNLLQRYEHLKDNRFLKRMNMVLDGSPPTVLSPQLHGHFIPSELPDGTKRVMQTTISMYKSEFISGKALIITIIDMTLDYRQLKEITDLKNKEQKKAEERKKLIDELQEALTRIKNLHGLLPICSNCKKIRDDKGYWNHVENYISSHSEAKFTHGICPECTHKLYPELYKDSDDQAVKK